MIKRLISVALGAVLVALPLVVSFGAPVSALHSGLVLSKSVAASAQDGVFDVDVDAFVTGTVVPTDIVMVLDVSGSMSWGIAVEPQDLDENKDYYIEVTTRQGNVVTKTHVPALRREGGWYAQIEGVDTQVFYGKDADGEGNTYQFYTGFLEQLKTAASTFVQRIAQNAADYGADHRIAIVEFSSKTQNSTEYSVNTHENPYYANILTGSDYSPANALVSVKDNVVSLGNVFNSLSANGPTYSDDALCQATRIFDANPTTDSNRVVILFTDGGPGSYGWNQDSDSSAMPTANSAISYAYELKNTYDASVYTIGMFADANISDESDELNSTYINYISSNYPGALSMTDGALKTFDSYCTVGAQGLPLESVFSQISQVIGETIYSAKVKDVVSRYFFLTPEQQASIKAAYPSTVITENEDGTTTITVDAIDFSPVAVNGSGQPVSQDDSGIFRLNYSMTRRDDFLGGSAVPIGTADSGVYSSTNELLAGFEVPTTQVIVPQDSFSFDVAANSFTVYSGDIVTPQQLYAPDTSWSSDFAQIEYDITYQNGGADFNGGAVTKETSFIVKADITIGTHEYTSSAVAVVSVAYPQVTATNLENYCGVFADLSTALSTQWITPEGKSAPQGNAPDTEYKIEYSDGTALENQSSFVAATEGTYRFNLSELKRADSLYTFASDEYDVVTADETCDFTLTLTQKPTALTVTGEPKTDYVVGDSVDTTGLSLLIQYVGGLQETITDGFTVSPQTLNTAGTQVITVSYAGLSTEYSVTVAPIVPTELSVTKKPTMTSYFVGELINPSGMELEVKYNNGTTQSISSGYTISPISFDSAGKHSVTVHYNELTTTFDVTTYNAVPQTLTIEQMPTKTSYFVGDTVDTTGISLLLRYNSGKLETKTDGFIVTPQILNTAGTQTISIICNGVKTSYTVTVVNVKAQSISVKTKPKTTTFRYRSDLDANGLVLTVHYNNGTQKDVTSGYKLSTGKLDTIRRGEQRIDVTYEGMTTSFNVNVKLVWWQWLIIIFLFGWIWY